MARKCLFKPAHLLIAVLLFTIILAACGGPAQEIPKPASEEPESTNAIAELPKSILLTAGEPGEPTRILKDADSSLKAAEKRALSGDKFLENLYERPFTSKEMVYLPDIDITFATIASDDLFHYFSIIMESAASSSINSAGEYGVEFDRSLTGRGDLLVVVNQPAPEWSAAGVKAFVDKNQDVGGSKPMDAESGFQGDGYESELEFEGDKVAYARLLPGENLVVQLAISRALLGNPEKFLWGAWASRGMLQPGKMDYNDIFTRRQAGSPLRDSEFYPVNELHSLDNTCRLPFGFNAPSGFKGICISAPASSGGCPWPLTCYNVGSMRICFCIDPSIPWN